MEDKVIWPFYHDHPLILKENNVRKKERVDCYGCGDLVANLEMAYVCNNCSDSIILHKKCGELPGEIRHPEHPNHPMYLLDFHVVDSYYIHCGICHTYFRTVLGYLCPSCNFAVHISCGKICTDMLLEERKELQHRSHPKHPLTLIRKPAFTFRCDGCGKQDVDMAYICTTCDFWVHRRCAELPLHRECRHHHHHLSLALSFPNEHLKYTYTCGVCDKFFDMSYWVYFCGDCRYFVHINCVDQSTTTPNSIDINEEDDVIQFPLDAKDMSNKLITPFVMREKGLCLDNIPTPKSNNVFLPNYHDHPLSLSVVAQEEEADHDDDEEELIKICDVCVTPITSSSSPYYQCPTSSCNYSIHSICSMLPNTLQYPSSPNLLQLYYGDCQNIPDKNHNFTLYKLEDTYGILGWCCDLCSLPTNGMGYKCEECGIKIDVKCASLPTSVRHSSHLRRHNKPLVLTSIGKGQNIKCRVCYYHHNAAYCCGEDGCDFALGFNCLQIPMSVRDREWDKHLLLLTIDAYLNHPSDFFCEFCEMQMHPQKPMYHCRECDVSLHPGCLKTAAGYYRNFKFGRRYELKGIHKNHSLTYTCITLKNRCDVCHRNYWVYRGRGFECADCYVVVCKDCGLKELQKA